MIKHQFMSEIYFNDNPEISNNCTGRCYKVWPQSIVSKKILCHLVFRTLTRNKILLDILNIILSRNLFADILSDFTLVSELCAAAGVCMQIFI